MEGKRPVENGPILFAGFDDKPTWGDVKVRNKSSEPIGEGEKETVALLLVDGDQRARDILADARMVPIAFIFPEVEIRGFPLQERGATLREHPF